MCKGRPAGGPLDLPQVFLAYHARKTCGSRSTLPSSVTSRESRRLRFITSAFAAEGDSATTSVVSKPKGVSTRNVYRNMLASLAEREEELKFMSRSVTHL